jgi:hypothetical protein
MAVSDSTACPTCGYKPRRRKHQDKDCPSCGRRFRPNGYKNGRRSIFCSKACYSKYQRGHRSFWDYVEPEPTSGCFLWVGTVTPKGYARYYLNGENFAAHRYAYTVEYGPIAEGLEIDHRCSVRSCVNPRHLEAVPHDENIRRGNGFAAVNIRKTHCPRGHVYDYVPTKGGRWCRTCARAYGAAYYQANKARWKKASRKEAEHGQ